MIGIFSISYFGSIEFYKKITSHKEVIFDIGEYYTKQTIRNRMQILGPNGVQNLSLFVEKPLGNKTPVKNIILNNKKDWVKVHIRSLKTAYSSAPFFEHYEKEIYELIDNDIENLVEFNLKIINKINDLLDLKINYSISEEYVDIKENHIDYRNYDFLESKQFHNYSYFQMFPINNTFVNNLSILDALFCLGPMARKLFIK